MRNNSFGPTPVPNKDTPIPEVAVGGQYACLCLEISGTFTAGSLDVTGTLQGEYIADMRLQNVETGEELASNAITAAGLYWVACPAIQRIQITPSSDFTSDADDVVNVYTSMTECLPPASIPAAAE
jgi:hypothetical protein